MSFPVPQALRDYARLAEPQLAAFLDAKGAAMRGLPVDLSRAHAALRDYVLRGGKRLRGALVLLGHQAAGGRREDVLRAAVWRLEAGAMGPPELYVGAARQALAAFDAHLAERLRLIGIPPGGQEKFHIHAMLHIYIHGLLSPLPASIGIDAAKHLESSMHTHDSDWTPGEKQHGSAIRRDGGSR